jgi:hypothetical protein
VKVLVGEDQHEFALHKKLLCASGAFFRTHIEAIPPPPARRDDADADAAGEDEDSVLWLPSETPDMFDVFVLWLYQPRRFPYFLAVALQTITPDERRSLRTTLVRLHLFAAVIDLPALQDAATDALQDMYLRFDWDMSPRFLAFLYGECDAQHAVRLRKWAVAMFAWTLQGSDKAATMAAAVEKLFAAYPDLRADYHLHIQKMSQSRADVRIKNPQLRLPFNKLQSGERLFGFRQCSFHSHRAAVGEGICPHAVVLGRPPVPLPVPKRDKEEVESDASDADIISPVRDLNEMSYLDLS